MRLVLLGPPGCGKGTQATLLCQRNHLDHIGTGDLLRAAGDQGTPIGVEAKRFIDAGLLVPDQVVNDVIAERFHRADRPQQFVMDGYPRTQAQAVAFDALLKEQNLPLSAAVLIDVPYEEIVRRVKDRWSCPTPGCKATYHLVTNPPKKPSICDRCGAALMQREDDKEETVRKRLQVYDRNTGALFQHYRTQGLLREVAGVGDIEEIYANIMRVLGTQAGRTC
jgi:adenylate kinase